MSSEKNNGGVFHGNSIMNCSSSNGMDPFYAASNWDPIVSLNQSGSFENCSNMVAENEFANHTIGTSSNLDHFSEMVSSFGHIPQSNFAQNSENGVYGKRKRKILVGASSKNAEEEDPSGDTAEEDRMKEKLEENKGRNSRDKQAVKEVKDTSSGAEPSKDNNYVHVRAKRGQATNSHSLAERVRRERISERMRLLQELVPGCNKITGKAVMLDEIINYVQSLQQQVEFLSMKLATVNPELNVDIDRILSKDILNMRGSNGAALGIGPGINLSHPFPGYPQGTFNLTPGANAPFHSLPQHIWNNELQGILQMGFDSDPSVSSLGPNGLSKMEL